MARPDQTFCSTRHVIRIAYCSSARRWWSNISYVIGMNEKQGNGKRERGENKHAW